MAASLLRRKAGNLVRLSLEIIPNRTFVRILNEKKCLSYFQNLIHQPRLKVTRSLSSAVTASSEEGGKGGKQDGIAVSPEEEVPTEEQLYRERYIPITRRSVIRHIMEEEEFLTEEEKKKFEDFALALDSALVNKYHGILQELKSLFDPINPDKDTIQTRKWNRRERLDNEFWLLERLQDIMEKANFHELSKNTINTALSDHEAREGVRVSVNPLKYDILRFWALGREIPEQKFNLYEQFLSKVTRKPARKPIEYYKRVVVAIRLKKDQKLMLKAFKEVPVNALEMLLPDGTIKMSTMDKGILTTSAFIASVGIVAKLVTVLADMNIDWTLILTALTGIIGIRAWTVYNNRKNKYLVDVSRTLYYKNIANNRGLLTLLVDRAEDESFKEALLTYAFLLTKRSPSVRSLPSIQQKPAELGGITALTVEKSVEKWLQSKTGVVLDFDSSEAVVLLKNFGLLSESADKLHVLSLDAAFRNLPQKPQSIVARALEVDISEGYDRDEYLETEKEYAEEEKKSNKYGWF
ncbi:hypothetical protein SNE40_007356 [Patella caerulea]|uniref:Transmembrane protein 143 n=1 Tax=Patella caerulea TaxID=87958 RepID=A0AAN8JZK8_PATCE